MDWFPSQWGLCLHSYFRDGLLFVWEVGEEEGGETETFPGPLPFESGAAQLGPRGHQVFSDPGVLSSAVLDGLPLLSVLMLNVSRSVVSDSLRPQAALPMGVLQARILEWVAFPFCRGSSQPRDRTWVSRIAGRFLTV